MRRIGLGASVTIVAFLAIAILHPGEGRADLVMRFHNGTGHALKGIVQNIGIHYLRPGQVSEFRIEGEFEHHYQTPFDRPTIIPTHYVVNFEHMDNAGFQYCVWDIHWEKNMPSETEQGASITIYPRLVQSAPGYACAVSGQLVLWTPTWHHYDITGATIDVTVSK